MDLVTIEMLGVAQREAIELGPPMVHVKRSQDDQLARVSTMGGPQTTAGSWEPM